jgi:hypothetical protein
VAIRSSDLIPTPDDDAPPAAPSGLTATAGTGRITLSWTVNPEDDLAGYRLYRQRGAAPDTSRAPLSEGLLSETSYTDASITEDRTYRYAVTAVDTAGNESGPSAEASAYLQPDVVETNITRSFGNASGPGDYRLVALPGAPDTSLAAVVSGEAGDEWQAFWDDGSQFVRYDSSETFAFRKGRGFWLTSRQSWTVVDTIRSASLRDSTTAIPLNDGWTIVANPFAETVSWAALQAANGGDLQALWPFGGAFSDTSRTFRSASRGRAYYLFNDNPGRDSLRVPHPALTAKRARALASSETTDRAPRLALSAGPAGAEGPTSTVRIGLAGPEGQEKALVAPPGGLEAVSLRIVAANRGEASAADSTQTRLLMSDRRRREGEGETFRLRLTSRIDGPVELAVRTMQAMGRRSVALLDPTVGQVHDLQQDETIRLEPEDERTLRVALGTKAYVESKRQAVLPETVRLTSYPNPVQEDGTLEYALPSETTVTLRVYDLLGRRVATLAQGQKEAGRHRVRLDGTRLSSGVYFGRLRADGQTRTVKITVVK